MELTLQEKRKLIEFFEFLLDKEISKPLGEMNSEAVDNYIKILLDLQDKHVELSPEFIDEQVRKIFHKEETAAPETAKTTKKPITAYKRASLIGTYLPPSGKGVVNKFVNIRTSYFASICNAAIKYCFTNCGSIIASI